MAGKPGIGYIRYVMFRFYIFRGTAYALPRVRKLSVFINRRKKAISRC